MRTIFLTIALLTYTSLALSQEVPSLNAYKYAIVETIFYDDTPDEFGVSATVRNELSALGFELAAENKEAWPEELRQNACLGLWVKLDAPRRSLGRKRVTMTLQDCKGQALYTHVEYGNAPTLAEAYTYAANMVMKPLAGAGYQYEAGNVVSAEPVAEKDQTVREFAKAYMQVNGREPIEGLYSTDAVIAPASVFIREEEGAFVILPTEILLAEAEPMGQLTKSTLPGVYKIIWERGEHSFKSTAVLDDGKLVIEWINPDETVMVVAYTPL